MQCGSDLASYSELHQTPPHINWLTWTRLFTGPHTLIQINFERFINLTSIRGWYFLLGRLLWLLDISKSLIDNYRSLCWVQTANNALLYPADNKSLRLVVSCLVAVVSIDKNWNALLGSWSALVSCHELRTWTRGTWILIIFHRKLDVPVASCGTREVRHFPRWQNNIYWFLIPHPRPFVIPSS